MTLSKDFKNTALRYARGLAVESERASRELVELIESGDSDAINEVLQTRKEKLLNDARQGEEHDVSKAESVQEVLDSLDNMLESD